MIFIIAQISIASNTNCDKFVDDFQFISIDAQNSFDCPFMVEAIKIHGSVRCWVAKAAKTTQHKMDAIYDGRINLIGS